MQAPLTLKLAHGNWVIGNDFWGREIDLHALESRLAEGGNILLIAQRRMGKTSLMRELARRLNLADQNICLFVDLQGQSSPADAIKQLGVSTRQHRNLWQKTLAVFANALGTARENLDSINVHEIGVKLRAGMTSGDWAVKGSQIFDNLATAEKPVILFLDEVPILISRILKGDDFTITPARRREADEFLSWLRENCLKHQGKVRVVVAGSIGLEPVLRQGGLSATVNHLSPFNLNPWDAPTATGCLRALSAHYGLTLEEGVPEAMVAQLGCCIPHHVQMFFARAQERCLAGRKSRVRLDEIADIYAREMLSVAGHAELTHYEERLKMVLGPADFTLAVEMLTETALSGSLDRPTLELLRRAEAARLPVRPSQELLETQKNILWVLEHDGYLQPEDNRYVFVSRLLRDWWKARHGGLFYTPVAERGL